MMFTLERLFHIDLSAQWSRAAARYEPLTDAQYAALFEPIAKQAKEDLQALVRPRCLFHADGDKDAERVAKMHRRSQLWLILIENTEPTPGEEVGDRITHEILLNPESIQRVRQLLPMRITNGLPKLAEVQIALG